MGPCLCGDPYCTFCGHPGLADIEAAEQRLMDTLNKAGLSVEEYAVVLSVGLAAVYQARRAVKAALAERAADICPPEES